MDNTPNLALPLLANKQALQTTFHDEALKKLDALVMLSVIDRDLSSPPASPNDGDRYLVQAPGSGDPAWLDNQIVFYLEGNWIAHPPRLGWTCYVEDEGVLIAWDGTAWQPALDVLGGGVAQNLALLGIGTTADAVNPVSAKINNALWAAKTVAEGGDGDLRYKLSKESAAKTLSLLFQDNFSGRAEIGLTGDDDFRFKVSADGSAWTDALVLDRSTGGIRFLAHETSVASAATCDIGAAAGLKVNITGTTGITSFGTQPHRVKFVRFSDALTLSHNASSLILPGAANIVTAAGDTATFASDASGNWRCLHYAGMRSQPRQAGAVTPHESLIVKTVSASEVDVDADAAILFDDSGNARRYTAINVTGNLASAGENGRDAGSEANSTEYHMWLLGKPDGTVCMVFSTSASSPAKPSGYTYKGYLGSVYNNGSGNLRAYFQNGTVFTIENLSFLGSVSDTSYTSASLAAGFPSKAAEARINGIAFSSSGTNSVGLHLAAAGSGTTPTYGGEASILDTVGVAGFRARLDVPILTPQTLYYRVTGTNGAGTASVTGGRY